MPFDRIGPYGLNRGNLLAASLVIGFRAGSRGTRIWCIGLVVVGVAAAAFALATGAYVFFAVCAFWLAAIFLIVPMLRSLKGSREIYLSYDADGILADTPKTQTLYKWSTIERTFRAGPWLFVMINGRCGIVISERFTTARNIEALEATVLSHLATRPIEKPTRE